MNEGDIVFWNDPAGLTSDCYVISHFISEEIVYIYNDYSEAEVYSHELELVNKNEVNESEEHY